MQRRQKNQNVCYLEPKVDGDESGTDFSPDGSLYEDENGGVTKGASSSSVEPSVIIEHKTSSNEKSTTNVEQKKHEILGSKDEVYEGIIKGDLYLGDAPTEKKLTSPMWQQGMQYVYHDDDQICETWYGCNICGWLYHRVPGDSTTNMKNHAEKHTRETYKLDRVLMARIIAKATLIAKTTGPLSEARVKKIMPAAPITSEIFLDNLLPGATVQTDAAMEVVANESLQQRALRKIRQTPKKVVDETRGKTGNEVNFDVNEATKTAKSRKKRTKSPKKTDATIDFGGKL